MAASRVLLAQVARMLALNEVPTPEAARAAIRADPGAFASALFAEAADSDDVTGMDAARDHLEARLAEFQELVLPETDGAIRAAFAQRLAAWASATRPQ